MLRGVLVCGEVTRVERRQTKPKEGKAPRDLDLVFVLVGRSVVETWGDVGQFVEGQIVCLDCNITERGGFWRNGPVAAQDIAEFAKAYHTQGKAAA